MAAPILVASTSLLGHAFVAASSAALEMSGPVNRFPTILSAP